MRELFAKLTDKQYSDGVIRMVAVIMAIILIPILITLFLAAVILPLYAGFFLSDLPEEGGVSQNAQAGVTFEEDVGNKVEVQLNSVQSADHVWVEYEGSADLGGGVESPSEAGNCGSCGLLDASGNGGDGEIVTVNTSGASGGETITVVGQSDGKNSIIQTYDVSA